MHSDDGLLVDRHLARPTPRFAARQQRAVWLPRMLIGCAKAIAVGAILLWSLFPIAFVILSSFKSGQDIFAVPPKFLFAPTWDHYGQLWSRWLISFDGLLNGTITSIGATVLAISATTSSA